MLTFITGIIGFLTLYAGYAKAELFNLDTNLSIFRFILFILSAFTIVCSWGHALSAIKIGDCPTLPRSEKALEYIDIIELEDRLYFIKKSYKDVLKQLIDVIDAKLINLTHSYSELIISVYFLSALSITTVLMEIYK